MMIENEIIDKNMSAENENKTENEDLLNTGQLHNVKDITNEENETFVKPELIKPSKKKNNQNEYKVECKKDIDEKIQEQEIKFEKSPSQRVADKIIPIPYKEPPWSGLPPKEYGFEVIKNGVVIENISLIKPFLVVGRLSNCDIIMDHPSISRFHCVIQYRGTESEEDQPGVYIYDLESTHGTFLNKYRLMPKKYNRLKVGHIVKFGGSSRMFILQGPGEDEEPESKFTVTELKAQALERKLKLEQLESGDLDSQPGEKKATDEKSEDSEGIDWGMGEDAIEDDEDEESDGFANPFATNEELFLNDPKKTLRGWYEREGYDFPEYKVEEVRPGVFKAALELPAVTPGGKPIVCAVEHRGKKKEVVVQCALEACRILDRQGFLRQSTHESHVRKRKDWSENDYYDSDEDEFLDRTGDIERKRIRRKRELEGVKGASKVETYDSLKKQYEEVVELLEKIEKNLTLAETAKKDSESLRSEGFSDADEFEAFMKDLSSQVPDKHKRIEWKMELVRLRKEEARLRKLVNIARPWGVSEIPERISDLKDAKTTPSKYAKEEKLFKRKAPNMQRVHEAFLDDDEETKPKLRKINCEDTEDDIRPIPYNAPRVTSARNKGLSFGLISGKDTKTKPIFDSQSQSTSLDSKPSLTSGGNISTSREHEKAPISDEANESEVHKDDSSNKDPSSATLKEDSQIDTNIYLDSSTSEAVKSEENDDSCSLSKRIIGPTLPPTKLEFSKPAQKPPKAREKKQKTSKNPFDFEGAYETWVPPQGQTGDGRTSLNDKLGCSWVLTANTQDTNGAVEGRYSKTKTAGCSIIGVPEFIETGKYLQLLPPIIS